MSHLTLLADTMVAAGQHYSLDQRDLRDLCAKMAILSFKYVDRQALWALVFPDAFVDWSLVRPGLNTLGDLHIWIPLLELCTWEGVERHESAHPPLANMRKAVRLAALDAAGNWNLSCQLLVLHMLHGVPSLQAFQMLTCRSLLPLCILYALMEARCNCPVCFCRSLKRETHAQCALLLASLSDTPHTPQACEAALAAILGRDCFRVDTSSLETHLRTSQARRDGISAALRQQQLGSYHGRPRLRDRAAPTDEQKARLDSAHGTWESFVGFCQLHQFPNVLSESVKTRLYFLAAQTTWDWRPHVQSVLRHDGDLCERVGQFPVSRPDLRVLHQCVDSLRMDGTPPFQEMTDFKNRCFRSFPVSFSQRMNLTQVLRLYVCAYQPPSAWKDLWKMQVNLLSPQIIKDCESFAASVPFAAEAFMPLLCPASVFLPRDRGIYAQPRPDAPE